MSNDKFDTARQVLRQQKLTGERALFQSENLAVYDSVFEDGESPLKESSSLYLDNCLFRWKYPLWYCKHVDVKECTWFDMARAGVWYTDDISVRDSIVEAPKNFRRCRGVTLTNIMGGLALARIPYESWLKWAGRLLAILGLTVGVILSFAMLILS